MLYWKRNLSGKNKNTAVFDGEGEKGCQSSQQQGWISHAQKNVGTSDTHRKPGAGPAGQGWYVTALVSPPLFQATTPSCLLVQDCCWGSCCSEGIPSSRKEQGKGRDSLPSCFSFSEKAFPQVPHQTGTYIYWPESCHTTAPG